MKKFFIFSICMFFVVRFYAQKTVPFAVVDYKAYSLDPNDPSAKVESHEKCYFSPQKVRMDFWYGDGSMETYFDAKANTITHLESGGGENLYFVYDLATWKQKSPFYVTKLELLPETKTLLGYNCKCAKVFFSHNDVYDKIFYTEDLMPESEKNNTTKLGVPGFVLERTSYNRDEQIIRQVSADSFKKEKFEPSIFIPNIKNYTKHDFYK